MVENAEKAAVNGRVGELHRIVKTLTTEKRASRAATTSDPGGGGYLTKFYTGRLRPEVQPLTLSYTSLAEKVPLLHSFY